MKIKGLWALILTITLLSTNYIGICAQNNPKQKEKKTNQKLENLIKKWHQIIKKRLSYQYLPLNFDPFEPIKKNFLKPAPIDKRIIIYFKNYSINDLKLVGIVKIDQKYIAIIEDPLGRGFFLKKGDYIGKEASIITKITKCKVYISQKYIDNKGNIIIDKQIKILSLHEEEKICLE